jgi:hypothetical protein
VPPAADFEHLPIEFDGPDFRLVDASSILPRRSDRHYFTRDPSKIAEVICHQTQGSSKNAGRFGLLHTAEFFVADDNPATEDVEGRAYPGFGYTFYVPWQPELGIDFVPIIYRCQPDNIHSYHTKHHNIGGVGIAFQGHFRSRNERFAPDSPSPWQRAIFQPLLRYLIFHCYQLSPLSVFGHNDFGKEDCPGDEINAWIDQYRIDSLRAAGELPLESWAGRSAALVKVGVLRPEQCSDDCTPSIRFAIERLQRKLDAPDSGLWSRPVDTWVRHQLNHKKEITS